MNGSTSYPNSAPHHAYIDHQAHMAHGHPHSQPPYSHYQQSAPMMPPHMSSYAHHPYGYGPPMAPSHAAPAHYQPYPQAHHTMNLPAMAAASAPPQAPPPEYPQRHIDTTGQVSPPGMRPKVTATLWEDEGTLCFQVESDGICVARREDNHMINGTKLLNVARMTRGRRDGILKSEKIRNVVKIGPMHLKGVWIPYDRALEFANKEKITEKLYPLFVHNVGALLHQPAGHPNVAAARRGDSQARNAQTSTQSQSQSLTQTSQPPSMPQSLSNPVGAQASQQPHSIAPLPSSGRPALDRAHTYPTPPSNHTSLMGLGNSGSSYEYTGHAAIDSKSMPTTPATTPPGTSMNNSAPYTTSTQHSYDGSRQAYSVPPSQQSPYGTVPVTQTYYSKGDMAPPSRAAKEEDGGDSRDMYANDRAYTYNTHVAAPPSHLEQVSPSDAKGSPRDASGRTTPRTMGGTPHWQPAYATPQRPQTLQSSSLGYVAGDDRDDTAAGTPNGYPVQAAPSYTYVNGSSAKRGREPDDDGDSYGLPSQEHDAMKRRKMYHDEGVSNRVRPSMTQHSALAHHR